MSFFSTGLNFFCFVGMLGYFFRGRGFAPTRGRFLAALASAALSNNAIWPLLRRAPAAVAA
jgi:hypothetical protein